MNRRTYFLAPEGDPEQPNGAAANPPDLAGYGSVDELARAYRASGAEAKRLKAEADQYRQALDELRRPSIPQRSRPEEYLQQIGVDPQPIIELMDQRFSQAMRPLAQMASARQEMLSRYPDYNKFESEVAQFISSDPERLERYNRLFSADPAGAIEYGILAFTADRQKSAPSTREPREETVHAQVPGPRSADTSRRSGDPAAARDAAWQRYQQNPSRESAEQLARLVIRSDPSVQSQVGE